MYKYKIGDIIKSKSCGDFTILRKSDKCLHYDIMFISTGFTTSVHTKIIKRMAPVDPYCPTIEGIGYIGEGSKDTKSYNLWVRLIYKCYNSNDKSFKYYGGAGVTVCNEWHNYQNFKKWFDSEYIEGYDLDKDLKNPNHKEYSPDNCLFIPPKLNNALAGYSRPKYTIRGDKLVLKTFRDSEPCFNLMSDLLDYWTAKVKETLLLISDDPSLTPLIDNWVDCKVATIRSLFK